MTSNNHHGSSRDGSPLATYIALQMALTVNVSSERQFLT